MQKRWMQSGVSFDAKLSDKIDYEARSIFGAVMCEIGEAKGHGVLIDQQFIADLVAKGQEYKENGVGCRFGHPGMCSESLGTQMGRINNWRLSEDQKQAIADVHFYDAASISPSFSKDPVTWIFKQAEEDPNAFGMSIVFTGKDFYKSAKGKKVYPGDSLEEGDSVDTELVYVEMQQLFYTDLVEEPAATKGLFAAQLNADKLGVQVFEFLDMHPELFDVLSANPEVMEKFLGRYQAHVNKKNLQQKQNDIMSKAKNVLKTFAANITKMFEDEEEKENYAVVQAVTDAGVAIAIVAAGETPAIGDSVMIEGTDDPAPEGDHVISECPTQPALVGATVTVDGAGVITAINTPEAEVEAAAEDQKEEEEAMGAIVSAMSKLNDNIKALTANVGLLTKLNAELSTKLSAHDQLFEKLKSNPYMETVLGKKGDVYVPGAQAGNTAEEVVMNASHNQEIKKLREKQNGK